MGLFTLAAPIFDLAMKISGHNKVLVELGARIKEDENKIKDKSKTRHLLDLGGGTGELVNSLPESRRIFHRR